MSKNCSSFYFPKTTVQKIRDARGFVHQTLGKFDQKCFAAGYSGKCIKRAPKRGAIQGGTLPKGKYQNKKEVKDEK